jgi:hypothetical protein
MSAKKTNSKKVTAKKSKKPVAAKKPNAMHEKLIKLFTRPNGATITDTVEAGFKYPVMTALRMAERRGYKTNVIKKDGELTRYVARKA